MSSGTGASTRSRILFPERCWWGGREIVLNWIIYQELCKPVLVVGKSACFREVLKYGALANNEGFGTLWAGLDFLCVTLTWFFPHAGWNVSIWHSVENEILSKQVRCFDSVLPTLCVACCRSRFVRWTRRFSVPLSQLANPPQSFVVFVWQLDSSTSTASRLVMNNGDLT